MPLKKSLRDQRGQTVTEFALVLPLLMLVLLGIMQFGILFRDYLAVVDAVRAGARVGVVSRTSTSPTPKDKCEQAVTKAAADLGVASGLVVTCTSSWARGADLKVVATYPYDIDLLGKVVKSGRFTSETTERVE